MKDRRRIALIAAGAVVLVLVLLAAFPLLFRDRIIAGVKAQVDSSVDAHVDWGATRLTLLRTFPNLTLRLDDVSITGIDRFEGDTLVSAARFALVLDAWSLLRSVRGGGAVVVRSDRAAAAGRPPAGSRGWQASWDDSVVPTTPRDEPGRGRRAEACGLDIP
jgi:uncharacterized protein involved in outer membrane biogenesis